MNEWTIRHYRALREPRESEAPLVHMLNGWTDYADHHRQRFGSSIGSDYVLGDAWLEIGKALRTMLNGDLGRLDAGTLDGVICHMLTREGFDPDTYDRIPDSDLGLYCPECGSSEFMPEQTDGTRPTCLDCGWTLEATTDA